MQELFSKRESNSCFNSTLVQLKVLVFVLEVLRLICFNSTLVQLKDADHFRFSQWEKKFQFYLSSIKSLSTERWFECLHMFQFYLSSIKRISGMPSRQPLIGFNSTLVQLKVSIGIKPERLYRMFQFYLSSIKSGWFRTSPKENKLFQFYLSSIKSHFCIVRTRELNRVSILP